MTAEDLLIAMLTVLGIASNMASLVHVLKIKSIEGISVNTILMASWSCGYWLWHGAINSQPVQFANNGTGLLALIVMLVVGFSEGLVCLRKIVLTSVIWLAFTFVTANQSLSLLGLSIFVLMFLMKVPQTMEAWKNPGGKGLSIKAFGLGGISCAGWAVYGLLESDRLILATSIYCLAQCVFVMMRTLQGRKIRQAQKRAVTNRQNLVFDVTQRPLSGPTVLHQTLLGTDRAL